MHKDHTEAPNLAFNGKIVMIGFGSVGQAVTPLIFRHIKLSPSQVTIISKKDDGREIAEKYGVNFIQDSLKPDNYLSVLKEHLKPGDFLLNLSVDVSSAALIEYCQENGMLYLDTCIEPWAGGYVDRKLQPARRSNYSLRNEALALRKPGKKPTAVLTHGANPGLVSHLVKQALLNIAADNKLDVKEPITREEWAALAQRLNIKAIHIAERDTQVASVAKRPGEFVNTWSIDGFVSEGCQPAELGWGTHERELPENAGEHATGCKTAIFINRPGASTRVRTWTPLAGPFHAFLITHGEAISIPSYLTVKEGDTVQYRPTCHYAYHPCNDAVLSVHELAGREWDQQPDQRLIFDEITDGMDELGVLLMGNEKGAYWFGSQITIHEARELAPYNNATSIQIASSVLGGIMWAMENPEAGIVEPEEMDFHYVLKIVTPYLGKVSGHYTDWTPLKERERLFDEAMFNDDPWQFKNILVN
jgi:homospermidine synthase